MTDTTSPHIHREFADHQLGKIARIIQARGIDSDDLTREFDILDQWLSGGGCLPTDWQHAGTLTSSRPDYDTDGLDELLDTIDS